MPDLTTLAQLTHPGSIAKLEALTQERELFRAAWRNANARIGELNSALLARRLALDYAEAERVRLAAATALWRRRYRHSWGAIAFICGYAGLATVGFFWMVVR